MIKKLLIQLTKTAIKKLFPDIDKKLNEISIEKPANPQFGDYSVNIAFTLAKKLGKSPQEIANELANELSKNRPAEIERIEAIGGYVNLFLSKGYLQEELLKMAQNENFGLNKSLNGKTVMVEYTDPNPFKLFHIGHLMSNTIGESIARLHEAMGAKVLRTNYQGDVGLHVAKTVWGMKSFPASKDGKDYMPSEEDSLSKKVEYLGQMYTKGSSAYESFKSEIEDINKKIYERSDSNKDINKLYDLGKKWSLEYFDEIYKKLGTKFVHYFFESEMGPRGIEIVNKHPDIFQKSEGAMVFQGEKYGLHTRVFINSQGLPTYEAKELGLNKEKFDLYNPDESIIITGNEITEYFKVLKKVMELTMPEVAQRTRHIPHGMLRLPAGKMSSRTGDVITAEWLIDKVKKIIVEKAKSELDDESIETIALGAIKYSILKQGIGHDIIFDFDKSLSVQGDSGPYLQYAYARMSSILSKVEGWKDWQFDASQLNNDSELNLIKHLLEFPDTILNSSQNLAPHSLAQYLYELANLVNRFYELVPILKDENAPRRNARLALISTTASVLKSGLGLLGINVLEKI